MVKDDVIRGHIELNSNRRVIYNFLSQVYAKEVDEKMIEELRTPKSPISTLGSSEELKDTEMAEGFRLIKGYFEEVKDAELAWVKERLAVDYASLFLGVGRHPAHPYESVYRSGEHLLMQEQRDQVLKIYREHGVDKVKDFPEPEDHVAIELQFMALLSGRTLEALEKKDVKEARKLMETQADFLDDHLMKWMPDFCEDILKGAKYDFYRGIAKATRGYVSMESQNLRELASELD